jgi:polyisoprenoid-binding protein YceI
MKLITFFLLLIFSLNIYATTWSLNDDHSEVFFSIEYLNVSEVTGRFKKFSGAVELDEKGIPEKVEINLEVNSIDTGNRMRDGHLRGAEFFQEKLFPSIFFKSSKIQKVSDNKFMVSGNLQIRKEKKPAVVYFSLTDEVTDTWGHKSRFAKFESSLKRSDFKLSWNKTLLKEKYLVGDDVKFWGRFQFQPITDMTPTNKHMIPDTEYIRQREKINRGEITLENKPFEKLAQNELIQTSSERIVTPSILPDKTEDTSTFRKSPTWWTALFVLGFLGFLSVIVVGFYSKNLFAEYFPRKYEENGILGYATDFFVIILVLVYSVAFWIVGWGGN